MSPTLSITFHPWTLTETDALLELMQEFNTYFGYPFHRADKQRILEELAVNPHYGEVWLIRTEQEAAPIGYFVLAAGFSFEYGGRDGFLDELYLRPACRGQGVGTRTLGFAFERARVIGIRCLHLEVERSNEAGQKLYRRYGFDDQDRLLLNKWL